MVLKNRKKIYLNCGRILRSIAWFYLPFIIKYYKRKIYKNQEIFKLQILFKENIFNPELAKLENRTCFHSQLLHMANYF